MADVRAEKSALRFGSEEGLIICIRQLEVAINVAGVAESQVQNLPGMIVSSRGKHLRFQHCPAHTAVSALLAEWFGTIADCADLIRGGGCGGSVMRICSSSACTSGSGWGGRGSTSQRPSSIGIQTSTI